MLMSGRISVGVVAIAAPPKIAISTATITNVYGRWSAKRTIHIKILLSYKDPAVLFANLDQACNTSLVLACPLMQKPLRRYRSRRLFFYTLTSREQLPSSKVAGAANNSSDDQVICRSNGPPPTLSRHFPSQHPAGRPYSRRPAAGWLTSDNSSYAAWGSSRLAAAMFSSRCLIEEVPGIGRITLDLLSNHANATCRGLASRSAATFFMASSASRAWPSGAHGRNAMLFCSQ